MTPNPLANDEIRRANQSDGTTAGGHRTEEQNRDLPAGDPDMPTAFRSVDQGSAADGAPARDGIADDRFSTALNARNADPLGLPDSLNGEGSAADSTNLTTPVDDRDDTFSDTGDDVGDAAGGAGFDSGRPPLRNGDTGYAG